MGGSSRECRCSCDTFGLVLRIFTLVSHLCLGAAACWGFVIADQRYRATATGVVDVNGVVSALNNLTNQYAVFQGLMSFYFAVFVRCWCRLRVGVQWLCAFAIAH